MKTSLCLLTAALLSGSTAVHASPTTPETAWITLDRRTYELLQTIAPATKIHAVQPLADGLMVNGKASYDRIHIAQVNAASLDDLSHRVHQVEHHCAGYVRHASLADAKASLRSGKPAPFTRPTYEITHQSMVNPMLEQMVAINIEQTILSLSNFQNRYYNSSYGAQSSDWIANEWRSLASGRSDVRVEQTNRGDYAQASVVLTIEGNELADQVLVMGAHQDSINHNDRNGESHETARAPGADDDASGVASLTEVLRVLVVNNYQPRRTIKLMAYAAEEVGLLGSGYIANDYANRAVNVVGVLQLDMTNYKGSVGDIYLVGDYTDSQQNNFLETVAAAYLPALDVAYTECGYACSDHASWTQQGYPASFPFEATFNGSNPYIHSSQDTYANTGGEAAHALKFARLALAYIVELADIAGGEVNDSNPNPGDTASHYGGSGRIGVLMLVWLLVAGLIIPRCRRSS